MGLLYSLVLDLIAQQDAVLPPTQGHHAHAFLLALIREIDADLSARLHAPGAKPFTASSLLRGPTRGPAGWQVREGARYALRFTALDEALFAKFLGSLLGSQAPDLRLGTAHFAIATVHTQPATSSWARVASFDQLIDAASADASLALEFCSPTAFQLTGNHSLLFPDPALVFGSLAARWNAFAPAKIDRAVVDQIAAAALVSRYRLETSMFDFGRYRKVGFVGHCHYQLRAAGSEVVQAANTLAAFAFFAGVGYKTTMGMGQARKLQNRT